MSEPIPESIPTSADPRTKRPLKKRALSPRSQTASQISSFFSKPDQYIPLPSNLISSISQEDNNKDKNNSKSNNYSNGHIPHNHHPPPPEIVQNVQGSSAGAGSGEFHVYKASRRREYERLRDMEHEVREEREDEIWERKKFEREERDREITRKKREKRERIKKKEKSMKTKEKHGLDMAMEEKEVPGNFSNPRAMVHPEKHGSNDPINESIHEGQLPMKTEFGAVNVREEVGIVIYDDN